MAQAQAQNRIFFTEIVGLRIYLALWVAVGHALLTAGFNATNPVLDLLLEGGEAVNVFMIVSGFVITNLLLVKQEPYNRYIVRRFFRLFPGFALACVAGYLLSDEWAKIAVSLPWAFDPGEAAYTAKVVAMNTEVQENLLPHAVAHATMLHGLLPNEILDFAPLTLLPAAWSISLEWQFYLLAPLIIAALRSQWQSFVLIVFSLIALAAYRAGAFGTFEANSFIVAKIHFFLLGIASRLGYDRLAQIDVSPLIASVVVTYFSLVALKLPISFMIWGVFLSYSLWHRRAPVTGAAFRLLTQPKPFQVLGEASYALYLIHRPLQVAAVWMLMDASAVTHGSVLGVQMLATFAVGLPLSVVIYFTIERWGIALGKRLADRLPTHKPALHAAPAATV